MFKRFFEFIIGMIVILSALGFLFYTIYFILWKNKTTEYYKLNVVYNNIGDLQNGSDVNINGYKVGYINTIELNEQYQAVVQLKILNTINIPIDSTFAIETSGIVGSSGIVIQPGSESTFFIHDGKKFVYRTKDWISIEDKIGNLFFSNKNN